MVAFIHFLSKVVCLITLRGRAPAEHGKSSVPTIGTFLLIVRLAISAWGTLAAILGTGTAALAAG